jgi:hypothetical protein
MKILNQHAEEPLIAYNAFCLALEVGVDDNGSIDYHTIAQRLRAIYKQIYTAEEVREWAKRYQWEFRLKLAITALHDKYADKYMENHGDVKLRRMSFINKNISVVEKLSSELAVKIVGRMDELPLRDQITTLERMIVIWERLTKIQREELGEIDSQPISITYNTVFAALEQEGNLKPDQLEQVRAAVVARTLEDREKLQAGMPTRILPKPELVDAMNREED